MVKFPMVKLKLEINMEYIMKYNYIIRNQKKHTIPLSLAKLSCHKYHIKTNIYIYIYI